MNLDSKLLSCFFDELNERGINYCVMNNYLEMPVVIPSDVDFAIEIDGFNVLDNLIESFAEHNNVVITQKIWHGYNKCAYILSPDNISSFFRLQLDFFVNFCAKGFPLLMENSTMLDSKVAYKNFYIPSPQVEAPFVMQRRIFKGDVEIRHLNILYDLYINNKSAVRRGFDESFGVTLGDELLSIIENKDIVLFNENRKRYYECLKKISNDNASLLFLSKYYLMQFVRAVYRLKHPVGLNVVVFGEIDQVYYGKFLELMSGSFHGTYLENDSCTDSFARLVKAAIVKRWHKTTKKISVIQFSKPNNYYRLFKHLASIDMEIENKSDMEKAIVDALAIQNKKTMKQLRQPFTPTGKGNND